MATKTAKKPGTALAPAGFRTGQIMPKTKVQGGGSGAAFIWVAHPMSGLWKDMTKKVTGLESADLIFVSGDLVERLQPMKFHLVEAFYYHAETDRDGEITAAFAEDSDAIPKDAKETVEALLVVYTSKGAAPATMRFQKAMCRAIGPMLEEYEEALTSEWASRSAENKLAQKTVPDDMNGFRFYGRASAAPKQTKDGKNTYPLGSVQVSASTSTEFDTLRNIDDAFRVKLESCRQSFNARVRDVKSMFGK